MDDWITEEGCPGRGGVTYLRHLDAYRSHSVAYSLSGVAEGDNDLYVMINGWWEPLTFEVQGEGEWRRVIDTALPSPDDIAEVLIGEPISTDEYRVGPRSVVVLVREGP
jgi:isoamylase